MKPQIKLLHSLWFLIIIGVGTQAASVEELETRLLKLEQEASLLKQEIAKMKQSSATNANQSASSLQQQNMATSPALRITLKQRPDNFQSAKQSSQAVEPSPPPVAAANQATAEASIVPPSSAQAQSQQQVAENTSNNVDASNSNKTSTAAAPMPMELLQAISQVQSGSFLDAETALTQYVKNEQNLHLDRAYYWLGEATYRQNKFEDSSKHFTQAYLNNKKGASAPDSLIRLGMSLSRIDKKEEACKVLNVVKRDFPDENIKVKIAQAEKTRIQCS